MSDMLPTDSEIHELLEPLNNPYSTMSDMPTDSEIRKFLEAYTDAWEKKIDNLEQKIKYNVLLSNPMSEIERNHLKAELKKIVAICEDADRTFCILNSMFQAL